MVWGVDFKEYEVFSRVKVPPLPFFVRVDGRGFRKLLNGLGFKKPFDESFAKAMVESVKPLFEEGFNPSLIYVFSDEANILFVREEIFERRLEKIVSVIPSLVSSSFTLNVLKLKGRRIRASFDARVVIMDKERIVDYLAWRQNEAWRNCLNSYAYYSLISKGLKPREASKLLKGLKADQLQELIFREAGVNVAKAPPWQRKGILIYKRNYFKEGYDPIKGERVIAVRREVVEDWDPPLFQEEEGKRMVYEIAAI